MTTLEHLAPALLFLALAGEPAPAAAGQALAGRWLARDEAALLVEFRSGPDGAFTGTVVRGHPGKGEEGHAIFRDLRGDEDGGWVGRLVPPGEDVALTVRVRVTGDALVAVASKLFLRKELRFVRAPAGAGGAP